MFEDFLSYALLSWSKASQNNIEDSFHYYDKISRSYGSLKKIQYGLLQCYFDKPETQAAFENLANDNEKPFSRYNFFLANYLLHKDRNDEAKKIIINSTKKYNSNLLLKQSKNFILNDKSKKIKNYFNCKKSNG